MNLLPRYTGNSYRDMMCARSYCQPQGNCCAPELTKSLVYSRHPDNNIHFRMLYNRMTMICSPANIFRHHSELCSVSDSSFRRHMYNHFRKKSRVYTGYPRPPSYYRPYLMTMSSWSCNTRMNMTCIFLVWGMYSRQQTHQRTM